MSGSIPDVIKYPRTAHLIDTGSATSDDLVIMDLDAAYQTFREGPVVVEEKVDGANMGFRVDGHTVLVQNRSRYISSGDHAQFSRVKEWVEQHRNDLTEILSSGNLILYGEWCAAKHSISYYRLPGYFIAFDLYDIEAGKFWSRRRFHSALKGSGIPVTPTIESEKVFGTSSTNNGITTSKKQPKRAQKQTTFASGREKKEFVDKITALLETPSKFRNDGGTVEGVVLRLDSEEWLLHRYKVVRPDFVSGCNDDGHWSRRPVDKQIVDFVFMQSYLDECYVFAQQEQHHDKESDRKDACLDTSDSGSKLSGSRLPAKEDGATKSTPKVPTTGKAEQKRQSRERQLAEHNSRSRRRRIPRCVMLMGLPGSGKSTFAQRLSHALAQDSSCTTVLANQDDLGRKQCFQVASRASNRTRVILDRCNLLEAERKEWLNCMHSPSPGEVALVYFSADADTCTQRVKRRTNHATIAHGTGARIVQQLSRRIETPTEEERKKIFGTIYQLGTFQEANDLLRQWGVEDDFCAPSGGANESTTKQTLFLTNKSCGSLQTI